MNKSAAEYSILRYTSLQTNSAVATSFKSGAVVTQQVFVRRLGKRVMKFRCPPGTRRAGKWTDRLGTDCELGNARTGLAKISRGVEKLDTILANREIIKDDKKKKRVAKRVALGQKLIDAASKLEGEGVVLKPKKDGPDKPKKGKLAKLGDKLVDAADKLDADLEVDKDVEDDKKKPKKGKLSKLGDKLVDAADKLVEDFEEDEDDKDKPKEPKKNALVKIGEKLNELADSIEKGGKKKDTGKTEGDAPKPKRVVTSDKPKKGEGKKPSGPAKASDAKLEEATKANEKNVKKKLPGKQIGNAFTNEENAKSKAIKTAQDTGQPLYVVKSPDGKFRIYDEERFKSLDTDPLYAIGPDGGIIDIPDNADGPDDIVEDVNAAVEKAKIAATAEDMKVAKEGTANLTKSKTGQFLPDDLTKDDLEAHRAGASDDLSEAFQQERLKNLEYWKETLGVDPDDFDDVEAFLAAIDKTIKDEIDANGEKGNKKLGVMNAERKNFLAMWVPDEGNDDVFPDKRINFVGPTRRHAIIEAAGLEGLVVSKSKSKKKPPKVDTDKTIKDIIDDQIGVSDTPDVDATEIDAPKIEEPEADSDQPTSKTDEIMSFVTDEWVKDLVAFSDIYGDEQYTDAVMELKEIEKAQAIKDGFGPGGKRTDEDLFNEFKQLADDSIEDRETYIGNPTPENFKKYMRSNAAFLAYSALYNDRMVKKNALGNEDDGQSAPGQPTAPDDILSFATQEWLDETPSPLFSEQYENAVAQMAVIEKQAALDAGIPDDMEGIDEERLKVMQGLSNSTFAAGQDPGNLEKFKDVIRWSAKMAAWNEIKAEKSDKDAIAAQTPPADFDPENYIESLASNKKQDIVETDWYKAIVETHTWDPTDQYATPDGDTDLELLEADANAQYKSLNDAVAKYLKEPNAENAQDMAKKYAAYTSLSEAYTKAKQKSDANAPWGSDQWLETLTTAQAIDHPVTDKTIQSEASTLLNKLKGTDPDNPYEALEDDADLFPNGDGVLSPIGTENKIIDLSNEVQKKLELFEDDPDVSNFEDYIMAAAELSAYQDAISELQVLAQQKGAKKIADDPDGPATVDVPAPSAFQEQLDQHISEIMQEEYPKQVLFEMLLENFQMPSFNDEDSIDAYMDMLADDEKSALKTAYGDSGKNLLKQYDDVVSKEALPPDTAVIAKHVLPEVWKEFVADQKEKAKQILAKKKSDELADQAKNIQETAAKIQASGAKTAGLDAIIALAGPDFDLDKLDAYETGKLGETIESHAARAQKYGDDMKKILDAIPENMTELSVEEQAEIIRNALGVSSNFEAAKRFARAAFATQYGDKDSLDTLRFGIAGTMAIPEDVNPMVDELVAAAEKADEIVASLPANMSKATLLAHISQSRSAYNRAVGILMAAYQQTDKSDIEKRKQLAKRIALLRGRLSPEASTLITKEMNAGLVITKGTPSGIAKGMPKPTEEFDSSLLGSVQTNGLAIAHGVPVGTNGIWEQEEANFYLSLTGRLSDIPDEFLKEAIWANSVGENARFKIINDGSIHAGGFNNIGQETKDKTTGFIDTVTGKRYVMKTAWRNDQEHIQEVAGARVAQILGEPTVGIRFGSELFESSQTLPNGKKGITGKTKGDERAIVMEHVGNLFGEGYTVYDSFDDLPSGTPIDPESLARLIALDRTMNYFDRTSVNVIPVVGPDGKAHLHPIDHGNAFYDFQGGDAAEQAAGFVKKTKSDNLPLFAMAEQLSDDDKKVFATALTNAVRRYQKADFKGELGKVGDTMNVSDVERQKLERHADWLEARKTSLDWDGMLTDAMTRLGLDPEEIQQQLAGTSGTKGFERPQGTGTLETIDKVLADKPKAAMYASLVHDGSDIENFEIRTTRATVTGVGNDPTASQKMVSLAFKLHGDALAGLSDQDLANDPSWELIGASVPVPKKLTTGIKFEMDDLYKHGTMPGGSYHQTYQKTLDDGTILLVTRQSSKAYTSTGTMDGLVRVLVPEGTGGKVDKDQVNAALSVVGVKNTTPPTAAQIQEMGVRALLGSILRFQDRNKVLEEAGDDLDAMLQAISTETGVDIGMDDFETVATGGGKLQVRLNNEKAKELTSKGSYRSIEHVFYNKDASTMASALIQGRIEPALRRFEHGVKKTGQSTPQDLAKTGAGDLIYTHKYTAEAETHTAHGRFISLAEIMLGRTDYFAFSGDAWGNYENNQSGFKTGIVGTTSAHEMDFRGGIDLDEGVLVVGSDIYQDVLDRAKKAGRTEINGVPIEDIVVPSGSPAAMAAAIQKLRERRGL